MATQNLANNSRHSLKPWENCVTIPCRERHGFEEIRNVSNWLWEPRAVGREPDALTCPADSGASRRWRRRPGRVPRCRPRRRQRAASPPPPGTALHAPRRALPLRRLGGKRHRVGKLKIKPRNGCRYISNWAANVLENELPVDGTGQIFRSQLCSGSGRLSLGSQRVWGWILLSWGF